MQGDAYAAVLGDFFKGRIGTELPTALAAGIRLHRLIDTFTDAHPAWRQSRARFPPSLRRFAGIAVDVAYDHFLAREWQRFHPVSLAQYAETTYAAMASYEHAMQVDVPSRMRRVLVLMRAEDWFVQYAQWEHIEATLARMSGRSSRIARLAETGPAMRTFYADLSSDFESFFPELIRYVAWLQRSADWRADLAGGAGRERSR